MEAPKAEKRREVEAQFGALELGGELTADEGELVRADTGDGDAGADAPADANESGNDNEQA